jgi:hypothetical protein
MMLAIVSRDFPGQKNNRSPPRILSLLFASLFTLFRPEHEQSFNFKERINQAPACSGRKRVKREAKRRERIRGLLSLHRASSRSICLLVLIMDDSMMEDSVFEDDGGSLFGRRFGGSFLRSSLGFGFLRGRIMSVIKVESGSCY